MKNTLQLYIDSDKQEKGYPITSPDRVIDEDGVSIKNRLKNNVKFNVIGEGGIVPIPNINVDNNEINKQINAIKEQVQSVISKNNEFTQHMNDNYGNARTDYFGKEHENVVERLNSDFDNVHQRINDSSYIQYSGCNITANNSYYGVAKETSIKGRTLQNLWNTDTSFTLQNSASTKSCNAILKAETTYTLLVNISESVFNYSLGMVYALKFPDGTADYHPLSTDTSDSLSNGFKVIKITIGNKNATSIDIAIHNDNSIDTRRAVVSNVFLIEGDYTKTPEKEIPFIEGVKSVGEKEITKDGKYPVKIKSHGESLKEKSIQESVELLLSEPLRGLPKGACDELLEDGTEIRRIRKVILNGGVNEDWHIIEGTDSYPRSFYICLYQDGQQGELEGMFSDKYPSIKSLSIDGLWLFDSNNGKVAFSDISNKYSTCDEWRAYLSTNSITLYYPLYEPVITKHNKNLNLKTFDGITHITSDNLLQPTITCKVPSNVQLVVSDLNEHIEALNTEVAMLNSVNEKIKATNVTQDELLDITMIATEQMYVMIEPLLASVFADEETVNPLVNMYVAMVKRGLKTIDHVPVKWIEQVSNILQLNKKIRS